MLLPLYLIGAGLYFAIAFATFKQDKNLSPKEIRLSWMILTIATVMWFLVVPISLILEGNSISQNKVDFTQPNVSKPLPTEKC